MGDGRNMERVEIEAEDEGRDCAEKDDSLREAATDALDADEEEHKREAEAFVLVAEDTDCRFERER